MLVIATYDKDVRLDHSSAPVPDRARNADASTSVVADVRLRGRERRLALYLVAVVEARADRAPGAITDGSRGLEQQG